jgi:hypothetical protein
MTQCFSFSFSHANETIRYSVAFTFIAGSRCEGPNQTSSLFSITCTSTPPPCFPACLYQMLKKTEEINILIFSWTDYIPVIKKIGRADHISLLLQESAPSPIPPAIAIVGKNSACLTEKRKTKREERAADVVAPTTSKKRGFLS